MKAIKTVYHGPTNTRGSRIVASDEDHNRISIPFPYDLDGMDAHAKAAVALCVKMKWEGVLHGGGFKDCYVFVFAPRKPDHYGAYRIPKSQALTRPHRCDNHNT